MVISGRKPLERYRLPKPFDFCGILCMCNVLGKPPIPLSTWSSKFQRNLGADYLPTALSLLILNRHTDFKITMQRRVPISSSNMLQPPLCLVVNQPSFKNLTTLVSVTATSIRIFESPSPHCAFNAPRILSSPTHCSTHRNGFQKGPRNKKKTFRKDGQTEPRNHDSQRSQR